MPSVRVVGNKENMIEDIKTKVTAKELELNALYNRMDSDFDLWNIKKRVFDNHTMAINITSNDPRSLVDKMQSRIAGSQRRIQVKFPEPLVSPEDTSVANGIERLFHYGFTQADLRLRKRLLSNLNDSLTWFSLVRGVIAVRVLVYPDKDGNVIFDYMPLDPRFLTYSVDNEGLSWVGYKTFRSKDSLKGEYGVDLSEPSQGRGIEVLDYWDREVNAVMTQNEELKAPKKHNLNGVPVVIIPVAMRPRIADMEGIMIEGYGESVYAPNRLEYEQCDRLASILATHANLLAKQPIVNYWDPNTLGPNGQPVMLETPAYIPGAIINLPNTHRLDRLPTPDIPKSLDIAIGQSRARIQRASFTDIEYGQLSFQLSGTALGMLRDDMDKLFGPRIRALSHANTDLCWMVRQQIIDQGLTVPVKVMEKDEYHSYEVTPEDLAQDYYLDVMFSSRKPWEELEVYQIIEMATKLGILSTATAREEIAKIPDAETEDIKVLMERAKDQIPEIQLYQAADGFVKQGRDREAAIVGQQLQQIIMARQGQMAGGGVPPEEEAQGGK